MLRSPTPRVMVMPETVQADRRKEIVSFILGLQKGDGTFQFSPTCKASNLYSTCFAVLALDLVGALGELPAGERARIADQVRRHQSDQGSFFDQSVAQGTYSSHDEAYVRHQQTDFALMALGALGSEPIHDLHFARKYEEEDPGPWLEAMNWADPWKESNRVMFVLNFLLHRAKRGSGAARARVDGILDWLDEHQDPDNGLWNLGHRVSLVNQMAGAYHFLFFYTYVQREPRRLDRIIDACLAIQDHDGLFTYAGGGGSCEDLDAVDLLCRSTFTTQHRIDEVRESLRRAHRGLWANQNGDGGFCWAKRDRLSFGKLLHMVRPSLLGTKGEFMSNAREKLRNQKMVVHRTEELTWAYSGLEVMRTPLSASDVWSTWFRALAIATIERTFPELAQGAAIAWNMRREPGLGYYR